MEISQIKDEEKASSVMRQSCLAISFELVNNVCKSNTNVGIVVNVETLLSH